MMPAQRAELKRNAGLAPVLWLVVIVFLVCRMPRKSVEILLKKLVLGQDLPFIPPKGALL